MKQVELEYIEVLNETEQIFIFTTLFQGKKYANTIILNMATPTEIQDALLKQGVEALIYMNKKVAATAEKIVPCDGSCGDDCKCKH